MMNPNYFPPNYFETCDRFGGIKTTQISDAVSPPSSSFPSESPAEVYIPFHGGGREEKYVPPPASVFIHAFPRLEHKVIPENTVKFIKNNVVIKDMGNNDMYVYTNTPHSYDERVKKMSAIQQGLFNHRISANVITTYLTHIVKAELTFFNTGITIYSTDDNARMDAVNGIINILKGNTLNGVWSDEDKIDYLFLEFGMSKDTAVHVLYFMNDCC